MTLDEALAHCHDVIVPRLMAQGQHGSCEAIAVLVAAVRENRPSASAKPAEVPRPRVEQAPPPPPPFTRALATSDMPPPPSKRHRR